MKIRSYSSEDRDQVITLWQNVFSDDSPHNEPSKVIDVKLAIDEFLFVAEDNDVIIGTAMAGYDGHRGWLYLVAVDPQQRRKGIGQQLVKHAMQALKTVGCIKVNIQIRSTNNQVVSFYESIGFVSEDRISMGQLIDP